MDGSMNLLFLIHRYPPAQGGSERYVQEVARRMVAAGHEVSVYTSDLLEVEGFWQRGGQRLVAGREEDAGVEHQSGPRLPLRATPETRGVEEAARSTARSYRAPPYWKRVV